ncbi:hypothetical protein L21SP3_02286 [Sedimentisphaera cyanobacteriorum]|uniref:Uncharacterized protein n=1 Tax=Sedimentisphaera cyanobacteriorum TaxID=1940790 RepID=A0A1Q2HT04_9BACT|nr:hypothetical protein [Sedimentisphaera cyanobacteriorum]AQQ10454.1 hypothetical protein L21SP3_02286 [Sedimentisphaera cyanobacteriorum]
MLILRKGNAISTMFFVILWAFVFIAIIFLRQGISFNNDKLERLQQNNYIKLGAALNNYRDLNGGYPAKNEWGDLLINSFPYIHSSDFKDFTAGGIYSAALNEDIFDDSLNESSVLLFGISGNKKNMSRKFSEMKDPKIKWIVTSSGVFFKNKDKYNRAKE